MFGIKVTGDILKDVDKYIADSEKAVQSAIAQTTNALKQELRQQVVSAGLGKRLSNTWRSKVYPTKGNSINAAGLVFSSAKEIIDSHSKGSNIKGKHGNWICIPLEAAGRGPKNGRKTKNIVGEWQQRHNTKLRFVYGKNGKNSYLVADSMRMHTGKRFGYTVGSKTAIKKGNVSTIPIFLVIPQVKMKKRLNPQAAFKKCSTHLSNYLKV